MFNLTLPDNNAIFDQITNLPASQAVDSIAMLKTFQRDLEKTIKELEEYYSSPDPIIGENYTLTTTYGSTDKEVYNPNKVFPILKDSLKKDFLSLVKVTKKDLTKFCKDKELKIKDFADAIEVTTSEAKKTISLKINK